MESNYVHKDSTTLVQDELVKNELNQIELQYNALKQQKSNELLKENQELKAKINGVYEERTYLYNKLSTENEQLNILVNSCQEEIRELKKQVEENKDNYNCLLKQKEQFEYIMSKQVDYQGQQKEFIKYMNDTIEDLETENVDDEEMKGYLIQRIHTFKEILQKYKSIIGDDK